MNILLFSGSRNRDGQTARAIAAVAKGAESSGAARSELREIDAV